MNEYIYVVRATRPAMLTEGPTDDETRIVSAHFEYLRDLTDRGTMVLVGRTTNDDETTFGIAVYRAQSDDAARAIMDADPAVAGGVMSAVLYPFHIALSGKG